jgi:hypothetical protein
VVYGGSLGVAVVNLKGPTSEISICSKVEIGVSSIENDFGKGIRNYEWFIKEMNPFDQISVNGLQKIVNE